MNITMQQKRIEQKGLAEKEGGNYREIFILHGIRRKGYAGGVFFELARSVIEEGGIVVGAAYMQDFSVGHIEAENIEELKRIVGVKYAESTISREIKEKIRQKLEIGLPVAFAGTLCQLESVNYFLNKEYEKFYTIAVKCSGVIQAKVWKDYIDETQINGSIITEICCPYRGEFGISQKKLLIKFSHGTAYFRDEKQDKLLRLRNAGLIYNEECYRCRRKPEYSKADIFLERYYDADHGDSIQEMGLTQVTIFTDKGKELLLSSRTRLKTEKRYDRYRSDVQLKSRGHNLYQYYWKYYERYGFSFASDLVLSQMESVFGMEKNYRLLERCALLDAKGISIDKVLTNWGIKKVILYTYGTIGKIFAEKFENSKVIYAVIHPENYEKSEIQNSERMKKRKQIIDSNLPVLVIPGCFVPDVMAELKEYGICRKQILPLSLLVDWEYDCKIKHGYTHTIWNHEKYGIGDIYLITGAQFANKGAQSMLFVAVSELRRIKPDCDIYFLPVDFSGNYPDAVLEKYKFHILREKDGIYSQLYDLLPQLEAIIDISGYALASKWNCSHFIHILLLAKNNHIPIYYMPQSFGPLDFTKDWERRIKGGLAHASVIFAREKEGYDLLTQKYHLKNCRLSKDMVLQNKKIIIENIYTENVKTDLYQLNTSENIAIVPNMRNYESGNRFELLNLYQDIITELLKYKKNIYIVSHSDDEQACCDLYEMFSENGRVFWYKKRLDCLEFGILAEEFQYMIASRYHAVVHAYKKGIPCIVIGWAGKYKELLCIFGQEKYVFDVRSGIDKKKMIDAVRHMEEAWPQEKRKIWRKLSVIQKENCFDILK